MNNVHAFESLYKKLYHDFPRLSLQPFKNLHYKNQWAAAQQPRYHPCCRLLHATIQRDTHCIHVVGPSSARCCWVEKCPRPTFCHASGNTFLWLISTRYTISWSGFNKEFRTVKWFKGGDCWRWERGKNRFLKENKHLAWNHLHVFQELCFKRWHPYNYFLLTVHTDISFNTTFCTVQNFPGS